MTANLGFTPEEYRRLEGAGRPRKGDTELAALRARVNGRLATLHAAGADLGVLAVRLRTTRKALYRRVQRARRAAS
jgi:hypothetical protein